MKHPMHDPLRSEITKCARSAHGLQGFALDDISIQALGFADVSSIGSAWDLAQTAFDELTVAVALWDDMAQDDEPWDSCIFVEEGIPAVGWNESRRAMQRVINTYIDAIIFAGVISHLPTWTVES